MTTLILLGSAVVIASYISYLKGVEDTTQGNASVHQGTKNDVWHRRARRGFWLSQIGWFIPAGSWWLLLGLVPMAYLSFVCFRWGVYVGGGQDTYGRWYNHIYSRSEILIKAPLRRLRIIKDGLGVF